MTPAQIADCRWQGKPESTRWLVDGNSKRVAMVDFHPTAQPKTAYFFWVVLSRGTRNGTCATLEAAQEAAEAALLEAT